MKTTTLASVTLAALMLAGCSAAIDSAKDTLGISPTPSASAASDPQPAADVAARAEAAALAGTGAKSWTDACMAGITWACGITEFRDAANVGNVEVWIQEHLTKDDAAQRALAIFNFAGIEVEDLQWVIVMDGTTGGTAAQLQRASVPLLNR